MKLRLPSAKVNIVIIALMLGVMAVAVTYGYYSSRPPVTQSKPIIEDLQLRSTSVDITSLNVTGLSLNVNAVVYNPNVFGATLDSANYSVYANGHYVGSGHTTHSFDFAPQSSRTLLFPVSIGWKPAFEAMGRYILDWAHVNWEIKGKVNVVFDGISLSAPFEFTAG